MATNYPQEFAPRELLTPLDANGDADTLGGRMMDRVRQLLCGLHGHDHLLQFERDRMFLKCVSCGHESPGWDLNETAPIPSIVHQRVESARAIAQHQLVDARRIA